MPLDPKTMKPKRPAAVTFRILTQSNAPVTTEAGNKLRTEQSNG